MVCTQILDYDPRMSAPNNEPRALLEQTTCEVRVNRFVTYGS
jgi:hypothetical protein